MQQTNSDNAMLGHVVRLQDKGLNVKEIEAWFARYGIYDLEVSPLAARAKRLTQAQREVLARQSARIVRRITAGIAFGSAATIFVIAWIFVGIVFFLPLGSQFLGGTIGAGLKAGIAVKDLLAQQKPAAVFVGGVIGWLLFVGVYILAIGDVTLIDLFKALLLWLLSTWYLSRVQRYRGEEGALLVFVVMSLIYFGLVYLVVSW